MYHMVDGRNPAPVDSWLTPLFTVLQASKMVQDFATIYSSVVYSDYIRWYPINFLMIPIWSNHLAMIWSESYWIPIPSIGIAMSLAPSPGHHHFYGQDSSHEKLVVPMTLRHTHVLHLIFDLTCLKHVVSLHISQLADHPTGTFCDSAPCTVSHFCWMINIMMFYHALPSWFMMIYCNKWCFTMFWLTYILTVDDNWWCHVNCLYLLMMVNDKRHMVIVHFVTLW